jgi:hypothetical protein
MGSSGACGPAPPEPVPEQVLSPVIDPYPHRSTRRADRDVAALGGALAPRSPTGRLAPVSALA